MWFLEHTNMIPNNHYGTCMQQFYYDVYSFFVELREVSHDLHFAHIWEY